VIAAAAAAVPSEGHSAFGGDRDGDACGTVDGAGGVVDGEAVSVELVRAETGVATQRDRLDRRAVACLVERGSDPNQSRGTSRPGPAGPVVRQRAPPLRSGRQQRWPG